MIGAIDQPTILANLQLMIDTVDCFQNIELPDQVVDYLGKITSLQATAIETQASAKYWLLTAINVELTKQSVALKENKIPPSIAKMRADAQCAEWHYLYERAERCSRAISHTIDAVRTKISYLKQEMNQR